jgi:hypothetical protein
MTLAALPFCPTDDDEVELTVVDLGVARAFWEGVPTARLLARIRLHRDERDLIDLDQRASGIDFDESSWDIIIARLLAAAPASLERLKRAVARHARAASDEGPLAAGDTAIASLVHAHLSASDVDASAAEAVIENAAREESVARACARYDERLGRHSSARRAAYFEACLELTKRGSAPAWPLGALRSSVSVLSAVLDAALHDSGGYPALDTLPDTVTASPTALYPLDEDGEITAADRRICLLDRAKLERALLLPPRDLSTLVDRAASHYGQAVIGKLVADVAACTTKHGALVLVATREPRSHHEAPAIPPASWAPVDHDATQTAATLAAALERGAITGPRARSLLIRGGDPALDAVGKEMLNVAAHPFASAVFAELLAPFARERDVVRLVTYFAIAPDPRVAAHALDLCNAREVVSSVLKAWLETMLPADGAVAEPGTNPQTSVSARVALCIDALRPYPALFQVVKPLLSRLSEAPATA